MEARSYTLEELLPHTERARVTDPSLVPVSPLRLQSYLHNPRARPTDHVLFELRDHGRLIAYRTVLPDSLYTEKGEPHRFAWLSGNYVLPEYRRKGISTTLLQQVEARWEGQLMYTNYAPESKAVYDRTGQFRLLTKREGTRFYLRAASADLLKGRLRLGPFPRWSDRLVNAIIEQKLKSFNQVGSPDCMISRVSFPDAQIRELIESSLEGSLFRRDTESFAWILQYPWVTDQHVPDLPYPFSYKAERFENILYKFELTDNKGLGILWLVLHNRRLSAPYLFVNDVKVYPHMAWAFMQSMIGMKAAYATIRNRYLEKELHVYRKWFLSNRSLPQSVFAHKMLADRLPATFSMQDGDGDVVFTG